MRSSYKNHQQCQESTEEILKTTKLGTLKLKGSPKNFLIQSQPKNLLRQEFYDTLKHELKHIRGEPTLEEIRQTIHHYLVNHVEKNDIRHHSVDQLNLSSGEEEEQTHQRSIVAQLPRIGMHRFDIQRVDKIRTPNPLQISTTNKSDNQITFHIKLQDDPPKLFDIQRAIREPQNKDENIEKKPIINQELLKKLSNPKNSVDKIIPDLQKYIPTQLTDLIKEQIQENRISPEKKSEENLIYKKFYGVRKGKPRKIEVDKTVSQQPPFESSLQTSLKPIHIHSYMPKESKFPDTTSISQLQIHQNQPDTFTPDEESLPSRLKHMIQQSRLKAQNQAYMDVSMKRVNIIKNKAQLMNTSIMSPVISIKAVPTSARSDDKPVANSPLKEEPAYQYQMPMPKQQKKIKKDHIYYEDSKFPRDIQFQEKYATLRTYYSILNVANSIFVIEPVVSSQAYKFYVGKGNNGVLVKNIIKSRWWWQVCDQLEIECNFVWTQLRNHKYMRALKPLKKDNLSTSQDKNLFQSFPPIQKQGTEEKPSSKHALQFKKVLNQLDFQIVQKFLNSIHSMNSKLITQQQVKKLDLGMRQLRIYSDPQSNKIHNHSENNFHLGNKKALFYNMRAYYNSIKKDVFQNLPLTFHIKNTKDDPEYYKFMEAFKQRQDSQTSISKNIWIIKPGELTNRGHGIRVSANLKEIAEILNSREINKNGSYRTYIVQQYLDRPLLYNKRKFDIRCYMLFTSINGCQKGYWYQEGYIRTSSKEFSNKNLSSKMIHLTNDAVQKNGNDYGRYEKGNKVSFEEFQKFLDSDGANIDFNKDIYPNMRRLACDCIRAGYGKIDPRRLENNFELFGLDFMIDENFHVWLIEVNTNPCLELSSPLLSRIIPSMLENLFRIALDPVFPPPQFYNPKRFFYDNPLEQNKFELIFDEAIDANELLSKGQENVGFIAEEDESDEDGDVNE